MNKIIEFITNWAKERDLTKIMLLIIIVILWCLASIFFFHGDTGIAYRD
jgi:ABC-type uncharacterized transport system permease subunit